MIESERKPVDERLREGWRKIERDILALYDLPQHDGWEKIKVEINALVKEQYRREQEAINGRN